MSTLYGQPPHIRWTVWLLILRLHLETVAQINPPYILVANDF